MQIGQPTVAEIDRAALRANYTALGAYANGAKIMAMVKADAYGHGAIEVSRTLRDQGCRHFGVANLAEAPQCRAAGLDERIYLLGGFLAEQADAIVALDVTPAVFDLSLLAPLDAAARLQARTRFPVHFELD